jgi:hypothetical protein
MGQLNKCTIASISAGQNSCMDTRKTPRQNFQAPSSTPGTAQCVVSAGSEMISTPTSMRRAVAPQPALNGAAVDRFFVKDTITTLSKSLMQSFSNGVT